MCVCAYTHCGLRPNWINAKWNDCSCISIFVFQHIFGVDNISNTGNKLTWGPLSTRSTRNTTSSGNTTKIRSHWTDRISSIDTFDPLNQIRPTDELVCWLVISGAVCCTYFGTIDRSWRLEVLDTIPLGMPHKWGKLLGIGKWSVAKGKTSAKITQIVVQRVKHGRLAGNTQEFKKMKRKTQRCITQQILPIVNKKMLRAIRPSSVAQRQWKSRIGMAIIVMRLTKLRRTP